MTDTVNDRKPNFRDDGQLFLVRCFACNPEHGRENYALSVALGVCAWCGWDDEMKDEDEEEYAKRDGDYDEDASRSPGGH